MNDASSITPTRKSQASTKTIMVRSLDEKMFQNDRAEGDGIMNTQSEGAEDSAEARRIYLDWVLAMYGHITLPIDPEGRFPLERVYQPLQCRRTPDLAAEPSPPTVPAERARDPHLPPAEEEKPQATTSKPQVEYVTDGAEALTHSPLPRVVILGGPGSGKTTVLRQLLAQAAKRALVNAEAPLPLYIALPEWARSGLSFADVVAHVLHDATVIIAGQQRTIDPAFGSYLASEIARGKGFVCLDGLDEVAAADRLALLAHINATVAASGGTWVIGSRFTEYKGQSFAPAHCTEWELVPLDDHARRALVQQLAPLVQAIFAEQAPVGLPNDVTTAYLDALADHPTMSSWGENPLLLSLGLAVFVRQQVLPASRAALYAIVVDAMLAAREPDADARTTQLRVLAECALVAFTTYGRTFPAQAVSAGAAAAMQRRGMAATPDMVQRLLASGLLVPMTHAAHGFVHQTLQEYLVGVALAKGQFDPDLAYREDIRRLIVEKATRSRWGEPLRLMIGALIQQGAPGSLLAQRWLSEFATRYETGEGDPGYLYLGLALRCVGEWEADTDQWSGVRQVIASWCGALQQAALDGRGAVTARLQRALSDVRPLSLPVAQRFAAQLTDLLDHPQPAVQHQAVRAARALGAEGMPVLEKALLLPDSYELREARLLAFSSLAVLGERAIAVLLATLERENGLSEGARMVSIIGSLALRQESPQRRTTMMRMLIWKLGDTREDRDGDEVILDAAQKALRPLFAALAGDEARQLIDQHFPRLVPTAKKSHQQRRYIAIQVVGLLGAHLHDAEARRFIALLDEDDFLIKLVVSSVFGELGPQIQPGEISHIIQMLASIDFGDRYGAHRALATMHDWIDEPNMRELAQLLTHPNHETREDAARVLGKIGPRLPADALAALRRACDDDNDVVRHVAAGALGSAEESLSDAQMHALVDALSNPDWQVRLHTVEGLKPVAKRLSETDMQAVLPLVNDDHWTVANEAIYLLEARGSLLSSAGVDGLVTALHAATAHNRFAALHKLIPHIARLSDAQVPMVMHTLGDSNELVRQAAARALGALGDRISPEVWMTWLAQQSGSLREMAAQALGLIGEHLSDAGVRALMLAVTDQYSDVRVAALRALVPSVRRLQPAEVETIIAIVGKEDRFYSERQDAVRTLAGLGPDLPEMGRQAFRAVLLDTTQRYMGELRKEVVETLPSLGMQFSRDEWMMLLVDHELGVPMRSVLAALSDQVQAADIPFFIAALHDPQFEVGAAAAYMLGALGDRISDAGVEALIAALADDIPFAEITALSQVGQRRYAEAVAALREVLKRDKDYLYFAALQALRVLGVTVAIADIPVLAAQLVSEDYKERATAMQAFGSAELWPRTTSESLLLAGLRDSASYVREKAAESLEKLGEHLSPEAVQALVDALTDTSDFVRYHVIEALLVVASRLTLPQVQAVAVLLNDEYELVRRDAVEVLHHVHAAIGPQGMESLRNAAASDDAALQHEVYLTLAHLGNQEDEPMLIAGLHAHSEFARRGAARALGMLGARITAAGIQALIQMLADDDEHVRADAARALGTLDDYRSADGTQALLASLADADKDVRASAAHALGIGRQRTPVTERLEAEAIRVLHQQPPMDLFLSALQTQVVAIIGDMGYAVPLYMRMVQESLDWPFWEVQRQAAQALEKLRRGIPDDTILALLTKWQVREPVSVWKAVDAALAAILAEDSIED